MDANDQLQLLLRICEALRVAQTAAGQLPGAQRLREKLYAAQALADAWLADQQGELADS